MEPLSQPGIVYLQTLQDEKERTLPFSYPSLFLFRIYQENVIPGWRKIEGSSRSSIHAAKSQVAIPANLFSTLPHSLLLLLLPSWLHSPCLAPSYMLRIEWREAETIPALVGEASLKRCRVSPHLKDANKKMGRQVLQGKGVRSKEEWKYQL